MKKIVSLIIALTLLVSVLAVGVVASAEEPTRTVTFKQDKLDALLTDEYYVKDTSSFAGWITTAAQVREVFEGANFYAESEFTPADPDDPDDTYANAKKNYDEVRLEYTTGNPKYEDNWSDADKLDTVVGEGGAKINFIKEKILGEIAFRYVLEYKVGETTHKETSSIIRRYIHDGTRPDVSLSSTMVDVQDDGIKAGVAYSISTSLDIDDSSNTTVTYFVEKNIDGTWTKVYDSVDGVLEGHEESGVANGKITPAESEISDTPVYRITYDVVDSRGYTVALPVTMTIKVVANTSSSTTTTEGEESEPIDALKIVLYVVAGLSACGIVALIFIKPKQKVAERVVYTNEPTEQQEPTEE